MEFNYKNLDSLSHTMAHYLVSLHKLQEKKGAARVTDLARDLNLTKGSVSTALKNLKKKQLVREDEESKFFYLTDDGHEKVHVILSSNKLILHFLKNVIGVNEDVAKRDACLMEHLLSLETLEKLFTYLKNTPVEGGLEVAENEVSLNDYESPKDFFKDQLV
jgi:DtxR family transcriptional regulator, Mn-dependent transcriptional regulator